MTFKEAEDEEFDRIEREQAFKQPAPASERKPLRRLTREEVTHVWTTRFPPNSTVNADTFVYEFADALQTYLGIGE